MTTKIILLISQILFAIPMLDLAHACIIAYPIAMQSPNDNDVKSGPDAPYIVTLNFFNATFTLRNRVTVSYLVITTYFIYIISCAYFIFYHPSSVIID